MQDSVGLLLLFDGIYVQQDIVSNRVFLGGSLFWWSAYTHGFGSNYTCAPGVAAADYVN